MPTPEDTLAFDFETLTLGEAEDLEVALGASLDKVQDGSVPQARLLRALAWIVQRRKERR